MRSFQAVDESNIFVLGTDSKLWLEHAPFGTIPNPARKLIALTTQAFQAFDPGHILVLRIDDSLVLLGLLPFPIVVDAHVQAFQGWI